MLLINSIFRYLSIVLLVVFSTSVYGNEIRDIRMWHAPDHSRIVFDMTQAAEFKVTSLQNPGRVVVDLENVKITSNLPAISENGPYVYNIRAGQHEGNITRLVFDLEKPVRYFVQMLPPGGQYQYRLVVDLYDIDSSPDIVEPPDPTPTQIPDETVQSSDPGSKGHVLILVDPGHGGEDPGALGKNVYEKDVVLQISKRLVDLINQENGFRAELTRNSDYYVKLRNRTAIARKLGADLFVSVHADAVKSTRARGASVYALSLKGASSETAKWLANKENSSDLAGGVSLSDKDDLLAEVLLDLSMTKTISESISFGRDVLSELEAIGKVHSRRVEQAGFAVLKSPDIPSILVETAYITNPEDEKLLRSKKHQTKIAQAILNGIQRYVARNKNLYGL